MRAVTMYEARDMSRWPTPEQATERDVLIDEVGAASALLPARPESTDFLNGHGYVQHSPDAALAYKRMLFAIAAARIRHEFWTRFTADETHPMSLAGRLVDDSGLTPLNRAWYRLSCIDSAHREWGQPYFALNPEKGTHHEIQATR